MANVLPKSTICTWTRYSSIGCITGKICITPHSVYNRRAFQIFRSTFQTIQNIVWFRKFTDWWSNLRKYCLLNICLVLYIICKVAWIISTWYHWKLIYWKSEILFASVLSSHLAIFQWQFDYWWCLERNIVCNIVCFRMDIFHMMSLERLQGCSNRT